MHMVKQSSHLGSILVCLVSLAAGVLFLLERFGLYNLEAMTGLTLEIKALIMAVLLVLAGCSLAFVLMDGHKMY
jgi:hypothetical protein